jgi:hypothetical protein
VTNAREPGPLAAQSRTVHPRWPGLCELTSRAGEESSGRCGGVVWCGCDVSADTRGCAGWI